MTKKKREHERCPGSSQPPSRRHGSEKFGWCAECEHWRNLIIPTDDTRVRLRVHRRAA